MRILRGRDTSNHLPIADLHLSRRHCVIKKEMEDYKIVDLSSLNGVFVNSIPVRERVLRHGDRVELGASLFFFLTHEEAIPLENELSGEAMAAGPTVTMRWDESMNRIYDMSELNLLLKISSAVAETQDMGSLARKLLAVVFEVVPCDRGTLLAIQENSDNPISVWRHSRMPEAQSSTVSRRIVDQVVREKIGVLVDVQQTDLTGTQENISSLICVPFVVQDRTLGVLYLDTVGSTVPLNRAHLQLLNAIAGVTAPAIKNVSDIESLKEKSRQLQGEIQWERRLVGESSAMQKVFRMISKIAGADTTVLIYGESGTGKELAARSIHSHSHRADGSFVAINCAALPEALIESELFGHEKGAFTGAISQKKGRLEVANGGTLFLDEIAELSPSVQAKMLRVLQEREFERVGGTRPIRVDIRLIAATNKNLERAVQEQKFRQDLYYRLNVVSLEMPPLREMADDILLLARYFLFRFSQKLPRKVRSISPQAQEFLMKYDWPGNVRELENILERAMLLGSTESILPEDLPELLLAGKQEKGSISRYHETVNECKRELVLKAFEGTNQNYNEAASRLGIHVSNLYRLVRNLKLENLLKK